MRRWYLIDDCGDIYFDELAARTRGAAREEITDIWDGLTAADRSRRIAFEAVLAEPDPEDSRCPDLETTADIIKIK